MSQANPKKSRPTGKLREHRAELTRRAEERQAAYDALTPQEKMTKLRARPGNSLRERERLIAQIESGQAQVKKSKSKKPPRTGKDFIPTGRGH